MSDFARETAVRLMQERDEAFGEIESLRRLIADGLEAFRLTKEYVNIPDEHGQVLLPDIPGWSHFDWTERARATLAASS